MGKKISALEQLVALRRLRDEQDPVWVAKTAEYEGQRGPLRDQQDQVLMELLRLCS